MKRDMWTETERMVDVHLAAKRKRFLDELLFGALLSLVTMPWVEGLQ